MDELDLLQRARPDARPDDAVIARHRAALRSHLDAGDGTEKLALATSVEDRAPSLPAHDARPRRRALVLAAAAVVASVVVGGAVRGARPSDDENVSASLSDNSTVTSPGVEPGLACGDVLPVEIDAPNGFRGPIEGPGGDWPTPPSDDQLVRSWSTATDTIELRWPAPGDPEKVASEHGGVVIEEVPSATAVVTPHPRPVPSDRHAVSIAVSADVLGAGACRSLQLSIAATTPERALDVASLVHRSLVGRGGTFMPPVEPLVVETTTADELPDVPPCKAPAGVPHSDYVGGDVAGLGVFDTAARALRAFLDSKMTTSDDVFGRPEAQPTIADTGYTAAAMPDGAVAFVRREGAGVVVILAVPVAGGWTIDRWHATGC